MDMHRQCPNACCIRPQDRRNDGQVVKKRTQFHPSLNLPALFPEPSGPNKRRPMDFLQGALLRCGTNSILTALMRGGMN